MKSILQFFLSSLVVRLYQWFFIPKNLWYFDRHNGVIIIARAREVEELLTKKQQFNASGKRVLLNVYSKFPNSTFLFSDKQELLASCQKPGERFTGGVVGSEVEFFKGFCNVFPVEQRAFYVPSTNRELTRGGGGMGLLSDDSSFAQVIEQAKYFCR